ncbi:helix-turn-helix domain-containing protein [Phytoactinopolyspora limicola]|uniref:helix-turn-helix domain-containing protein n=1 Tax=Phytoactinopolyspora limicola TaxID=2715536 RepID=UPI001407F324|nr:helix-turn-helix domain-containing protein [Phytoactinopolyspora limicola]
MAVNGLLTSQEVADQLGVSMVTVARMARDGTLTPRDKVPGGRGAYLFDPADVHNVARTRPSSQLRARANELRAAATAWDGDPAFADWLRQRAHAIDEGTGR